MYVPNYVLSFLKVPLIPQQIAKVLSESLVKTLLINLIKELKRLKCALVINLIKYYVLKSPTTCIRKKAVDE